MNILFFLKPKSEVVYIDSTITIRRALIILQSNTYTAVPILSQDGAYIGTITEGDFLRHFKNIIADEPESDMDASVLEISRAVNYDPVSINADMEDLISKITNQNYVPVVDDNNKFIGIITRKEIIQYIYNKLKSNS
jgi:CBS domain-containing protein